jgi:cytochrome c-type protein NapB
MLASIGIGFALFGLLSGIREPAAVSRNKAEDLEVLNEPHSQIALSYSELAESASRQRRSFPQSITDLRFAVPAITDEVPRTEEMKIAALADRAKNRAFDGAPPTIPHPTINDSAASCLTCHSNGMKIGNRVASRISHELMTNCTQCHVELAPTGFPTMSTTPANEFIGVFRAGPGKRAMLGAPPTIPHTTWLRENCVSCHGFVTRPGTRTTHPWLTSCTQCHTPSAALDQVEFVGGR